MSRCTTLLEFGAMTSHDLDVVVLGGGGHVGLPLSLSLAKAGLRVGVYDTNRATLERISAWRDAIPREWRGRAASRAPSDRPAGAGSRRRDDRPHRPADRGRWNAGRRIPGTVDDDLREDRRPDRAHLRDGALVVLRSTVYPGTTDSCASISRLAVAGSTSPSARSGSPRATPWRSCTRCHRSSEPMTTAPASAPRSSSDHSSQRRSRPRPRKPSWPSSSRTRGDT